jgi:hypothetical protein
MPTTTLTEEEAAKVALGLDDVVVTGGRAVVVGSPDDIKVRWEDGGSVLVPLAASDRLQQARSVIRAGMVRERALHRAPQLIIASGEYAIELHGGTLGVVIR